MRSFTLKSGYLASLVLVSVLLTALFTSIFVTAQSEITINEDSLLLTDGSNAMQANLDMGGYNIDNTTAGMPYSYLIYSVDDGETVTYYAKNGETGEISWTSTNFETVIENAVAIDGKVKLGAGTFDLETATLDLNVTDYDIELSGQGKATKITYSGSSYALNVIRAGSSYNYIELSNFMIDGGTLTAGRNGIVLEDLAPESNLKNLYIKNFDVALNVSNTNTVWVEGTTFDLCNTGIYTEYVDSSTPNFLTIDTCQFKYVDDYGCHLTSGNQISIIASAFETIGASGGAGIGVFADGNILSLNIEKTRFETCYSTDIVLEGTNMAYPVWSTSIRDVYSNGANEGEYFLNYTYARKITTENVYSVGHNIATYYLGNAANEILISCPAPYDSEDDLVEAYDPDPFLLDGTLTTLASRIQGRVITPHAEGFIVLAGSNVTEGDVMTYELAAGYVYQTTTANDTNPCVVLFDSSNSAKPCVVATSGIAKINNATTVSFGDIMVTSTSALQADVANTQTNPTKIIGYIVGWVSASEVWVKIS